MATPIRIKRSSVEGKRPQVSDLQLGELALNTYDAELVTVRKRAFNHTFVSAATSAVNIQSGAEAGNEKTPTGATYIPSTGVLTLTFDSDHGLLNGDEITLDNQTIVFTCDADKHQSYHSYPRSTDPIAGVTTAVTVGTTTSFTINVGKGYSTEVVRTGAGATVTNVLYVTKDGDDSNTGRKLGDAKATIKSAVGVSTDRDVIRVSAGIYVEDNPIALPPQVSIVGDSLREVTVVPLNPNSDLFWVAPGNYITEMSYNGTMANTSAIVAFNPNVVRYFNQSSYIRNCTNFITNSIGMNVDGSNAIGPFKSMVTDSFTQYNSNGIGCVVSNEGYAQIVSMFTINSAAGIVCNSGGQCDVTNSNSSFGNYGMISDGVGPRKYVGIVTESQVADQDTFVIDLNCLYESHSVYDATYDGVSGIATIVTHTPHKLTERMGIELSNLGFTCDYGDYEHLFVSAGISSITVNTGTTYTAGAGTTYTASTGELVIDVGTAHGLSASSNLSVIGPTTYVPTTGLLQITTNTNHGLSNGDYIKILPNALIFKCEKDDKATEHAYPRISDPVYNKWLEVTVNSDTSFTVDVGATTGGDYTHEFVSSIPNGIKKAANTIGIATDGVTFTCSKDNYATEHSYPRTTDPAHNATLGIEAVTTNSFTVNVGVSTHDIFPTGLNGNIFEVEKINNSQKFSTYVGPNKHPHTYVSGGSVEVDVIRPFDGQAVYFEELYRQVRKIIVTDRGSGYTTPPKITLSEPSTSWGIRATAVGEIDKDGLLVAINVVSSGRGYAQSETPTITIEGDATAYVDMVNDYYLITESTPISSGITTITVNKRVPYAVGLGTGVPFYKQSRIIASSHSFEYIGTGIDPLYSLPSRGAVPIQDNEIDDRHGGLTIFTSTDQTGNFRIGDGVIINQQDGTITGDAYTKSLFSTMTPFILALGGD